MSSILNGVRWTEKRLTDEQLLLLEDAENRNLGCLKCEGISDIDDGKFSIGINRDNLMVYKDFKSIRVQITYCPFCGKKL